MKKNEFVAILRECGITDEQMNQLHKSMEKRFPDSHQAFLEFLKIGAGEIAQIRQL